MASQPKTAPSSLEAAQTALQIANGFIASAVLSAVLKLNIADHLTAGPKEVGEVAKAANVNADALYRMLRLLASLGLFTETAPRTFALTPAGEVLVSKPHATMRDFLDWWSSPIHFRLYAETAHSLLTGETVDERVLGVPCFEYLARDKNLGEIFNRAMVAFSNVVVPAVLEAYDFSGTKTLMDVGGGHGALVAAILAKYPAMRGINFDMQHVLEGAPPLLASAGVSSRCELSAGSFFEQVPSGADAHILKFIIHDWPDEKAKTILRNCRRALEGVPNAKVILIEGIMTEGGEPSFLKFLDMEMLLLPGGRERTLEEFRELGASAGLRLNRAVPTKSPVTVLEFACA